MIQKKTKQHIGTKKIEHEKSLTGKKRGNKFTFFLKYRRKAEEGEKKKYLSLLISICVGDSHFAFLFETFHFDFSLVI